MINDIKKRILLTTLLASVGMVFGTYAAETSKGGRGDAKSAQGTKPEGAGPEATNVSGADTSNKASPTTDQGAPATDQPPLGTKETPPSAETAAPTISNLEETTAPTLKINGFTLFNTYVVKQSNRQNGRGGAPVHFSQDVSDLFFTIEGKAKGIEYMYRVNFQSYPNSSPVVDENYIQIKWCDWLTVRLGATVGPEDFGIYDGGRVIGAAGGFESAAYENVYNLSAGVIKGNDNIGDTGNATKIVILGPDLGGFQLFVAYTPNTARRGDDSKNNLFRDNPSAPGNSKGIFVAKSLYPFGMNNWALGFNYRYATGPWNLILSGATVTETPYHTIEGGAQLPQYRFKLRGGWAYQLGMVVGYDRFKFGLGYLNNGKLRLPKIKDMPLNTRGLTTGNMYLGNSGRAWNTAVSYTVGAYQFAASYQHSWRKTDAHHKASNNVWTGTVDFNIFQGWKAYFEVDLLKSRTNKQAVRFANAVLGPDNLVRANGNNSGTVAILGTMIKF